MNLGHPQHHRRPDPNIITEPCSVLLGNLCEGMMEATLQRDTANTWRRLTPCGDLVLLQATSEKLTELFRLPMLNDKTWNHTILANKRLFLRNGKTAVCLQLVE